MVLCAVWGLPDVSVDDSLDTPDSLRRADLKQIPQMSMQPFSDQYRLLASAVSGATSIPLHYLGVVQDSNPSSAQAIEAHEVDMIRAVEGQQDSFGLGRRRLAKCVLEASGRRFPVEEIRYLRPRWESPRTRSLTEQSQFVQLQVQAGNFQAGSEATLRQLPLSEEEVQTFARENREAMNAQLLSQLLVEPDVTDPAVDLSTAGSGVFEPSEVVDEVLDGS